MTFKVGDRVMCIKEVRYRIKKGACGNVVHLSSAIGVDWGEGNGYHDCDGHCPENNGYYVNNKKLVLAFDTSMLKMKEEMLGGKNG